MINNILKMNNLLSFGKRDAVTCRQDREHSVAILGSSRETENTCVSRELAASVAKKLAQKDFDIWTGGCAGVPKAANQAAHDVNPKTSWAIEVKRFLDNKTKVVRALGIFNEKKDSHGRPIVKASGAERTIAFMKECDHTVILGGGPGSGEELWTNFEAKAYKWSDKDLCANDLVIINENNLYDADIKKLDLMEDEELANHPEKGKKLREIINKEVKINKNTITKADIERTSTEIANHIIKEANKKSDEKISLIK